MEAIPLRLAMLTAASAGAAGPLLEWYDFYIFATASALVFGQLFFPATIPSQVQWRHSAHSPPGS
jgi:hypothetical protein